MNLRLPENEQVAKPLTGRSSRKAYVSNGLQAGVDPSKPALSTGHQDTRSVLKYLIKSKESLASGSLQQAKRLRPDDEEQFAGVHLETQLVEKSLSQTMTAPDGSSSSSSFTSKTITQFASKRSPPQKEATTEKKEYHVTMNFY